MATAESGMMQWTLPAAPDTEAFGRVIGERVVAPAVIYLFGDLGAGKTTLARGILRGMGWTGPVKSPSYSILEPYDTPRGAAYHLDLYRIADAGELEFLGLRELMAIPAVWLVEWPELGGEYLPAPDLSLLLSIGVGGHRIALRQAAARALDWLPSEISG